MISSPKNVKIHIYLITQQFTPSCLPNRNENTYPQKTCIRMCVIALFLRAESQNTQMSNKESCLLVNRLWCIHEILLNGKKEATTVFITRGHIVLQERCQK